MLYRVYTINKKVPILATWQCSVCCTSNLTVGEIEEQSTYNDNAFLSRTVERRKVNAIDSLNKQLIEKYTQAFEKAQMGDYNSIQFDCQCKNCGHAEPWVIGTYAWKARVAKRLCSVFETIAALAFVIGLVSKSGVAFLVAIGCAAGIFVGFRMYGKALDDNINQTNLLPEYARPLLFTDVEDMKKRCPYVQDLLDGASEQEIRILKNH